jgi:RNA polymerase sigma factor (sigma-70 family)
MAAFRVLYERHVVVARRVAVSLAASGAEREDLVAEAFTQILRMLRSGRGPDEEFRAYLLRTMRNAMINSRRRDVAVSLCADVPDAPVVDDDPVGTQMHATVAADAFASLPDRWRMVLWRTEIDGESPAQIAPHLGMTPNGVAALAYRAREGLRQAYLDQHLPTVGTVPRGSCQTVVEQLPGWVRHGLTARKMRRITTHLDRCPRCRDLATDLSRLNHELPAMAAPLALGAPFVVAHLATTATGSVASSGAVLASTGSSLSSMSVPAASWLASAKTVIAGAAIVTTTAVGTVASDPAPVPGSGTPAAAPSSQVPARGPDPSTTAPPSKVAVEPSPANRLAPTPETTRPTTKHTAKQTPKPNTAQQTAKQPKKSKKEAKAAKKKAKKTSKKPAGGPK